MRDFRINLIFEGSSEIMHLFIAREAVDKHLQTAGDVVMPGKSIGQLSGRPVALGALLWLVVLPPAGSAGASWPKYGEYGALAKHIRFVDRRVPPSGSRGRFHSMIRFGPKLEQRQSVLFRLVDVGAELFAMAASSARVQMLKKKDPAAGGEGRAAGGFVLPAGARADSGEVPGDVEQRGCPDVPDGAGSAQGGAPVAGKGA